MKKMLSFVPLGIGISAALIYLFNAIQFKMIGNANTMLEALTKLRIYLYIAIIGFLIYFILKVIETIRFRKNITKEVVYDEAYEPFEDVKAKPVTYNTIEEKPVEKIIIKEPVYEETKRCCNCKRQIPVYSKYCPKCGANQEENQKIVSPFIKKLINVIEIVILILIIYFMLNMLFDFKEKQDPDFKSPFKVSVTK